MPTLPPHESSADTQNLEHAFSLFNRVSGELIDAYAALQSQVATLSAQLALANSELASRSAENAALSERLSLLLAVLPAGVVELDQHGQVIRQNPAAEAILSAKALGQAWAVCAHSLRATDVEDTYVLETVSSAPRYVYLKQQLLPATAGRIVLLQDVTHQQQLTQQIVAQERLVAMGRMAASLAHQLRTPLATAMLYTGHLVDDHFPDAERQRFASKSLERLRSLEGLIQDMLRFVRGEVGTLAPVALSELLQEVAHTVQPQAEAAGLRLEINPAGLECLIAVDRGALAGALVNLLENALHFAPPGSVVSCHAQNSDESLVLLVCDEGPGIDPELLGHVFEPFFTTRSDGTGLGLAIVQRVVESCGGRVWVENRSQGGACFTVTLPRVR